MDPHLAQFLAAQRPRVRAPHRAAVEEVAVHLGAWFRRRRRRAAAAGAADLRGMVAAWYLRHEALTGAPEARRFMAAVQVFARWHTVTWSPGRARRLRALVAAATRDTLRAARAGAMLDREPARRYGRTGADGFWQVTLRGAEHVVLREIRSGACVGPVGLPQRVVRTLPVGAVLNLRLGRDDGTWAVLEHGACYPALVAAELRGEPAIVGSGE